MKSDPANFPFLLTILLVLCLGRMPVCAQTSDSSTDDTKSWTGTSESRQSGINPTRTSETHTEGDSRTVDKQAVERIGLDGRYEPYLDTEKQSVKVDASTIRIVERAFGRDPDGHRILIQVTEEERRSLGDGAVKRVRNTSNPDANGRLQVVRREIQETKKIGPSVEDTKTTVLTPDVNGGLAAAMQIQERQKRSNEHTIEFRKSTLLRDGNGRWQVGEVREGVINDDGKERSKDEQVLRPDSDGNLSAVGRTVSQESESTSGEKRNSVETYASDVPGSFGDGSLHLNQKVTTIRRTHPDGGQTTEEQVERHNPGEPGGGLRVTTKTIDIVRPGAGGATRSQTIQSRDSNGNLEVVSIDMGRTDKTPAIQLDIAAPDKPKPTQAK